MVTVIDERDGATHAPQGAAAKIAPVTFPLDPAGPPQTTQPFAHLSVPH